MNYDIDIDRAAGRLGMPEVFCYSNFPFLFFFFLLHEFYLFIISLTTLLLPPLHSCLLSYPVYISGPIDFIWVRPDTFTKLTASKAATATPAQVCSPLSPFLPPPSPLPSPLSPSPLSPLPSPHSLIFRPSFHW